MQRATRPPATSASPRSRDRPARGRALSLFVLAGLSSTGLTGCPDFLELHYRVPTSELTAELGHKSVRYQRVEQLLSDAAVDKAFPDYLDAERDVQRAVRRQDLLYISRSKLGLALRRAVVRRDAAERFIARYRRARVLLDRCDLEVYPEEDYEIYPGRQLAKRWNRLVDTEHGVIAAARVEIREVYELQRLFVRALRAGLSEYGQGGGRTFLAAARAVRDYEEHVERVNIDRRQDVALERWEKARQKLIETFDENSDVDDLVGSIQERYPKSFFEKDGGFVAVEDYDDGGYEPDYYEPQYP